MKSICRANIIMIVEDSWTVIRTNTRKKTDIFFQKTWLSHSIDVSISLKRARGKACQTYGECLCFCHLDLPRSIILILIMHAQNWTRTWQWILTHNSCDCIQLKILSWRQFVLLMIERLNDIQMDGATENMKLFIICTMRTIFMQSKN